MIVTVTSCFYRNVGDSRHGYAIAGTVSGTSISFGAAEEYETLGFGEGFILIAPITSCIVYRDHGNSNYGTAIVGHLGTHLVLEPTFFIVLPNIIPRF